jgi:AcrR family transcriptional regulator
MRFGISMEIGLCYGAPMARKRLSREESRKRTKEHLLDAAERLIARKGLNATSVEDIVAEAGYSRGAFYSNFDSKCDLFIEILRRDHLETHTKFLSLRDDTMTFEQIIARLRDIYSPQYRNDDSFMNWAEARLLAVRDPEFRAKLGVVDAEKRANINELVDYIYRRAKVTPPAPTSLMAMGFVSLMEGVKLTMLSSPNDVTSENAKTVLSIFIDSAFANPRSQDATPSVARPANPMSFDQ